MVLIVSLLAPSTTKSPAPVGRASNTQLHMRAHRQECPAFQPRKGRLPPDGRILGELDLGSSLASEYIQFLERGIQVRRGHTHSLLCMPQRALQSSQ
jgi:hypothetical protein